MNNYYKNMAEFMTAVADSFGKDNIRLAHIIGRLYYTYVYNNDVMIEPEFSDEIERILELYEVPMDPSFYHDKEQS